MAPYTTPYRPKYGVQPHHIRRRIAFFPTFKVVYGDNFRRLMAPPYFPNPPTTNSSPASSSEDHQGSALNNAAVERRLFPETPAASRSGNLTFGQMLNSLTTKKSSSDTMLSSAKKLENIQKQVFSPENSHNFASNSSLVNFEDEESEQPKILNLNNA